MERGGFRGYQKLPKSSSGMRLLDISNNNDNNIDVNSACTVREQDRYMPIANVIRIMRKVIPAHGKISDDAKETIQECVSEYISFITSEANDRCQREQRKTITAEDVLWAMSKLGFDDYIEPLSSYLQRYREFEGDRGSLRGDPFVKRTIELAPLTAAAAYGAPAAAFHHMAAAAAHHHHHHQAAAAGHFSAAAAGHFSAAAAAATATAGGPPPGGRVPTMGDYFRDGHEGVNSAHQPASAMAANFDPYAAYK